MSDPSIAQSPSLSSHPPEVRAYNAVTGESPALSHGEPPSAAREMNAMAVVSFVSSLVVGLAAVVCGIVALTQIKRRGSRGRGLAIAGIAIGAVNVLLTVTIALITIGAALFASVTDFDNASGGGESVVLEALREEDRDGAQRDERVPDDESRPREPSTGHACHIDLADRGMFEHDPDDKNDESAEE